MKEKPKVLRNLIIFIGLILLTFYIILKDQNMFEIIDIIKSVNKQFVAIGIICMFLYLVCEAINIGRTLRTLDIKSKFTKNLKYAFIGFFFSAITPAASGGQPMQIYYMYKENIPVANSTLALLINLTSMQIITISYALISVVFNYKYLNNILITFFIIGIVLNLSALTLLLIGILSKKMSKGLVNFVIKILEFFKVKNLEQKKEKIEKELLSYQENAKYIKDNKILMLKTIATTAIQFIFYYSTTYWTYRAFGFNEYNIFQIISMQALLYATVSGIPSPGAVGVSEGAFTEIFRNVYSGSLMSSAVLLNRGINFYLFIVICGITTIINHIKSNKNV